YWRNPGLTNTRKGMILTAIAFLLIIAHPFGTITCTDVINNYYELLPGIIKLINGLLMYLIILATTYFIPYLFIRMSYPQLIHLRIYKTYSVFLISQIIINLFLIAFSMDAFPELKEALKTFIDSRYSRW
ncbi:MAG: hypothetical protein U9Q21_03560, partial [Candidatus Auribacterota bacterium]|nr:hypothetical protein [Candidatus Auribacterota bacterium]